MDKVTEAIGASSVAYGTCTANALSMNSVSLQDMNGTPKCLPISSAAKPLQSINRSPASGVPDSGEQLRDAAGIIRCNLHDLIEDMRDTQLLDAMLLQKRHELAGIQMVGIVRKSCELRCCDLLGCQRVIAQACLEAQAVGEGRGAWGFQPVRGEIALDVVDWKRKRMIVGIRARAVHPADKLRALLERSLTLAQKISFGDTDLFQRGADRGPGTLAHSDRRLQARFDQGDGYAIRPPVGKACGQHAGGDPTGGATANNHYPADGVSGQHH